VRAYYARRVVLIGAESTGKTSLAARLAAHYDTVWLPEYGREYIDRKQAPPEPDDIPRIAREQLRREDLLAQQANRLLLCDTDLIVTSVLSDYYFGACPAWIRQASYERSYDLHVLCDTDVPWEADPFQREGPAVRARLQGRYVEELEARGLPTVLVSGTVEARMRTATAAIDRLFAGSAYRAGLSVSRTDPK
jgi:NadR type nicotinamide-nucleotide adenylyltransferase